MRTDLKNLISWTQGPSAWDELLRMEAKIRKDIYDQIEARKSFVEWIGVFLLVLVTGGFLAWLGHLAMQSPRLQHLF